MYYLNPYIFHPVSVRTIYEFPEYKDPVEYSHVCRYKKIRCIVDKDTKTIYHETVSNYKVKETDKDQYIIVDTIKENRLDLISQEAYGTVFYWWMIAMANNIIDAFDVPRGTVLRIPYIGALYLRGSVLGPGGATVG